MTSLIKTDRRHAQWIADLKERYRRSQIKASMAVNDELLSFYWSLGRDIVIRNAENEYGSEFYETLGKDLAKAIPNVKGFSPRNLRYMKRFYTLFSDTPKNLPQVVANSEFLAGKRGVPQAMDDSSQLEEWSPEVKELFSVPWGHIRLLIDKCKSDRDKALFYVHKTVENGW